MDGPRKKAGWAFWTTILLIIGLPVLYVASFGPACWWFPRVLSEEGHGVATLFHVPSRIYWPIGWAALNCPEPLPSAVRWYATLRADAVAVPFDLNGKRIRFFRP